MRLIKLAMLGLFGYAVYEFLRGMLQDTQLGSRMTGEGQGGGGQRAFAGEGAGRQNISGPGEGTEEATLERNGGSVRHKVGRGVIS